MISTHSRRTAWRSIDIDLTLRDGGISAGGVLPVGSPEAREAITRVRQQLREDHGYSRGRRVKPPVHRKQLDWEAVTARALALRAEGWSYVRIAAEVCLSLHTVRKLIKDGV
jgi:hypothetical protein